MWLEAEQKAQLKAGYKVRLKAEYTVRHETECKVWLEQCAVCFDLPAGRPLWAGSIDIGITIDVYCEKRSVGCCSDC